MSWVGDEVEEMKWVEMRWTEMRWTEMRWAFSYQNQYSTIANYLKNGENIKKISHS
jgi:hypothetical protein